MPILLYTYARCNLSSPPLCVKEMGMSKDYLPTLVSSYIGPILPTNTEDKFGTKTPNPAAEMTLGYLKTQNAESARRKKMSKGAKMQEKSAALEAFDTAFPRKK